MKLWVQRAKLTEGLNFYPSYTKHQHLIFTFRKLRNKSPVETGDFLTVNTIIDKNLENAMTIRKHADKQMW